MYHCWADIPSLLAIFPMVPLLHGLSCTRVLVTGGGGGHGSSIVVKPPIKLRIH